MIKQTPQTSQTPAVFTPARFGRGVVVTGAVFSPFAANAAIDVSSITSLVSEGVVAAAALGLAFLAFVAGMAIYKKLRGAT